MIPMHHLLSLTVAALALCGPVLAAPPEVTSGERTTIQFAESPPQIDAEQLRMRLHSIEVPGPYDVKKETFEALLPKDYKATEPHGLLIWISPR